MSLDSKAKIGERIAGALCLLALSAAAVLACMVLYRAMRTVDAVNAMLVNINRPCKGPEGPDACGTLAQVNKGVIRMDDLATTAQMQVKQSGVLIAATAKNLDAIGNSVTATMGHLNGTADALTVTAQTASDSLTTLSTGVSSTLSTANSTLGTLNMAIATIPPLTGSATLFLADADTATKGLFPIEDNATKITASGAVIIKDGQIEADRFTFPPKTPWYKKIVPTALKAGELVWDFER